jgi:hypothetical protein
MKINATFAASALLLASGLLGHIAPVHAGDVSNAQLGCYVDTYAYDQLTTSNCASAWTPSTANNPTIAFFQVVGLPAGSYSYTWKDLKTGATGVCSSGNATCTRTIRIIGAADGTASMSVVVRDTQTGATKTVSAYAEFIDAYH